MRSIVMVTLGVALGIATTFIVGRQLEKTTDTTPSATVASATAERTTPSSPFATKSKVAVTESAPATQTDSKQQAVVIAAEQITARPNIPPSDISHYHELSAYLQHIDSLNSNQLEQLLDELKPVRHDAIFINTLSTAIYQRWGEQDTESAIEYAIARVNRSGHQSQLASLAITHLGQQYPEVVRRKIDEAAKNNPHSPLQYLAYEGIAAADPEKFLRELLASDNNNRNLPDMTMMALTRWAEKDPVAAWDFLNNESTDRFNQPYHRENILRIWFEQDPEAALPEIEAALNKTSHPEEQMMLVDLYISHLTRDNPDNALQWAMSLDNGMMRENAIMSILYTQEGRNASDMMDLISQLSTEDQQKILPMATPAIASGMARSDPHGAIQWAEQLPREQSEEAKQIIVSEWANRDPDAALDWILTLPDTPANHNMIRAAAYPIIYSNPATAMELFQRLPANVQLEMLDPIIMQQDPVAAEQWLSEQTNPEVVERGSLLIEINNPDADTYTILEKIAALPEFTRQQLILQFLPERAYRDPETVNQWLAETPALTDDERQMFQQIISGNHGSRFDRFGGQGEMYIDTYIPPIPPMPEPTEQ